MQFVEIVTTTNMKTMVTAAPCQTEDCEEQPVNPKAPVSIILPGHSHGAHAGDPHAHGDVSRLETVVSALTTEFSLALHSVLVGIAVGIVPNEELSVLIVALSFHQFFEGITLGARLDAAQLSLRTLLLGALIFALAAPLGIAIGIGLVEANSAFATSANFIVSLGVLEAISAGMLIHVGCAMLSKDLPADLAAHKGPAKMAALLFAVYLGFGAMAVIGKWL
jgi:zinc transporter 1/2/3